VEDGEVVVVVVGAERLVVVVVVAERLVVVVVAAERLVVVGVAERQDSCRRRRHGRVCSLVFSKRKEQKMVSVYCHINHCRGTFAWPKPASRRMVSLLVFMAEARLAAHETSSM
jgi:hypothetical protein